MIEVESTIEKVWRPHKVQEAFLRIPDTVFEALYGGALGGGKSEVLVLLPIIKQFHTKRKFKGIIIRQTLPELEQEIIGRSRDWYAPTGAIYNETKKRWTWPASGAEMRFGYAERDADIRRYDGVEYNYIGWDEATSATKYRYEY